MVIDHETQSGDPDVPAYDWHKGHQIAGIAAKAQGAKESYYIPISHKFGPKIPRSNAMKWLQDHLKQKWINHNPVFDACFTKKAGVKFDCPLVDVQTLCKVHDSDRWSHRLKELSEDWLGYEYEENAKIKQYLKGINSKDYGDLPADLAGEYACQDVVCTDWLYEFVRDNRSERVAGIWDTEIKLTSVLFDMEYDGLRIDPMETRVALLKGMRQLVAIHEEIEDITDRQFTNSHACIYDIFVNQFGLPILMRKELTAEEIEMDELGNPTFNKDALGLYDVHPEVTSQPEKHRVIRLIRQYRELQYMTSHFQKWLEIMDDDYRIHPGYNQVVRTGRMSTRNPNIQGMNKAQRQYIKPDFGMGFWSCDYSQIEFRLIIHYIRDAVSIAAYNENPNTDFHEYIAKEIGVQRKAGKTLNFSIGYGAGKRKVTKQLSANPTIIEEISQKVNAMVESGEISALSRTEKFDGLAFARAEEAYDSYHERLPGIKTVSREAARRCRSRGFVFNAYGRERHLPRKASHKAFNSIVQSCAMDIIKERMVALSPRYNEYSREIGLKMAVNVHDEVTTQVPVEYLHDAQKHDWVIDHLQTPSVPFTIPITTGLGISDSNWRESSDDNIKTERDGKKYGSIR